MRCTMGAIFSVTVPETIIRSACRGLGRNTSAPKRAISKREVEAAIISMAQHASPNVIGQSYDFRDRFKALYTVVIIKFFSNLFWGQLMRRLSLQDNPMIIRPAGMQ